MSIVAKKKYVSLKKSDTAPYNTLEYPEKKKYEPIKPESKILKPMKPKPAELKPLTNNAITKRQATGLQTLDPNKMPDHQLNLSNALENADLMVVQDESKPGKRKVRYLLTVPVETFKHYICEQEQKVFIKDTNAIISNNKEKSIFKKFDANSAVAFNHYLRSFDTRNIVMPRQVKVLNVRNENSKAFRIPENVEMPSVDINETTSRLTEQHQSDSIRSSENIRLKTYLDSDSEVEGMILPDKDSKVVRIGVGDPDSPFDLRRFEAIFDEHQPALPFPMYPKNYYGFIDDTYIELKSLNMSSEIKGIFECPGGFSTFKLKPNYFGDGWAKYMFAKLIIEEPGKEYLVTYFQSFDIEDQLDKLTIHMTSGHSIALDRVLIRVNDTTVYSSEKTGFGTQTNLLSKDHSLNLSGVIHKHRKYKVTAETNDPQNEILNLAALDLGQAWSPRYGAAWGVEWCGYFTAWAVRNATDLLETASEEALRKWHYPMADYEDCEPEPDDDGELHYSWQISSFFKEYNKSRYISPENCSYENLGEVVKPGFIAEISTKRHGEKLPHSTIFIHWENGFDPNKGKNAFKAIGGNQSNRINIKTFYVYRSESNWEANDRKNGIIWDEDVINSYDFGLLGFCNTSKVAMKMKAKPEAISLKPKKTAIRLKEK